LLGITLANPSLVSPDPTYSFPISYGFKGKGKAFGKPKSTGLKEIDKLMGKNRFLHESSFWLAHSF